MLFSIINSAKNLGSYSLANLAFAALADKALDDEKIYKFTWEKSQGNDHDDIYYDLLVISDGIQSASIPAPLLKNPLAFRAICSKEVDKLRHNRRGVMVEESCLKGELLQLRDKILVIAPNAQELAKKYLSKKECQSCPYFASGRNESAIHCSVYPFGYPEAPLCGDWEINLGFEEALEFQRQNALEKQWKIEREIERKKAAEKAAQKREQYQKEARNLKREEEELRKKIISSFRLSPVVQAIVDDWDNREFWRIIPRHWCGEKYPHCTSDIFGRYTFRSNMSSSCELSGDKSDIEQQIRDYAWRNFIRLKGNLGRESAQDFLKQMFQPSN